MSVNDEVIHGIPGKRVLKEGDIVSIDVGAFKDGFHGDCAATFACGTISDEAKRLIQVTRQSFFEGLKFAREGYRVPDISRAIMADCQVPLSLEEPVMHSTSSAGSWSASRKASSKSSGVSWLVLGSSSAASNRA